jgi:HD-GYP domain-containing protein (c-di-GMP phosphodiesterase class II)
MRNGGGEHPPLTYVMSAESAAIDAQTDLVAASRERVAARLSSPERLTHGVTAAAFLAIAALLAAQAPPLDAAQWILVPAFVAAIAVGSRIELEVGSGFTSPVELIVIPMLFALPAGHVPMAVAAGLVCGQLPGYIRGRVPLQRIIVSIGNASYTIAPSIVFMIGFDRSASVRDWAVVTTVAVCAQFAVDGVISTLREYFAVGVDPRSLLGPLAWIFFVDASLAPVGFAAGVAGSLWTPAYVLPLPLLLLARFFAKERADRLSHALELSAAYRGTAFLLGDVVEADDAYTGEHSRDVVELTAAVAERLDLDSRSRHLAELTALLHDVGKIKIPNSIINKAGPLTDEERAVVNMHTIEGERLLSRVGGLLTEVGRLVRSCHERYDGGGYPDGLSRDEIPIVARIVCCCDAFNAMVTARPYRPAMSFADARAELAANRGTQFDPDVVDVILALTVEHGAGVT